MLLEQDRTNLLYEFFSINVINFLDSRSLTGLNNNQYKHKIVDFRYHTIPMKYMYSLIKKLCPDVDDPESYIGSKTQYVFDIYVIDLKRGIIRKKGKKGKNPDTGCIKESDVMSKNDFSSWKNEIFPAGKI